MGKGRRGELDRTSMLSCGKLNARDEMKKDEPNRMGQYWYQYLLLRNLGLPWYSTYLPVGTERKSLCRVSERIWHSAEFLFFCGGGKGPVHDMIGISNLSGWYPPAGT
jgi:hypothetical protein